MLSVSDFSWVFLFDYSSSWPMAHSLNPFMIQMFFQNTWMTMFIILFWESIEVFTVTVTQGSYVVFVGDDAQLEPVPDSMLGDPFQGLLGLLLAKLVIFTFKIPSWNPSLYTPHHWLKTKRFIQYGLWVIFFIFFNYQLKYPGVLDINLGVWIIFVWTGIIILGVALTEHRHENILWQVFLNDNPDITPDKAQVHFDWCFIGWLVNAWILCAAALIHFWYTYFQVELAWAVAILFNVYIIYRDGRLWELTYFLNLRDKQHYGKQF